jgi:hypothetical protein
LKYLEEIRIGWLNDDQRRDLSCDSNSVIIHSCKIYFDYKTSKSFSIYIYLLCMSYL